MPRHFDPAERQAIRDTMKRVGFRHFERAGIRAARIEDICREVGIAKGSFYAFFESKEELFMTIVEEREGRHRHDLLAFIATATGTPRERAGGFFDLVRARIESDPVLNLVVGNNEIPHLVRRLGPERFAKSQAEDRAFVAEAAHCWTQSGGGRMDADDLLGLLTICLSLVVQRRQMTPEQYQPAIGLLRELFVDRLAGSTP